jgi:hypothetical protein
MVIRKVIFHDVPRKVRNTEQSPTVSQIECDIDPAKTRRLREKLVRVLTSSNRFDLVIQENPQSSVPGHIASIVADSDANFVGQSQAMAYALLEQQPGSSPAGLLTVLDCQIGGQPSVAILKLEREEGMHIAMTPRNGVQTIGMEIMTDLVLTGGTKLFKAAVFVSNGSGDYAVVTCDDQRTDRGTDEMAHFWKRFLGCEVLEAPRITTRNFFNVTIDYINSRVDDPVVKNDLYDSVFSELKSQKGKFAPKKFIEDYVPKKHQDKIRTFYEEQGISLSQFQVDISEIKNHLKKRSLYTRTGVRITVPEGSQVVDVQKERVVIEDEVTDVGPA